MNLDQATIDRAVATLLEIAEGGTILEGAEVRLLAAQTILSHADLPGPPWEEEPDVDLDSTADQAFRVGVRWAREHPKGRLPGPQKRLELAYGAL